MNPDSTLPLLPCKALNETLVFYRALGFAITHEQETPYLYASVQRGAVLLHFANLAVYGARDAFGASLLFVDDARARHCEFADGLRDVYGAVPTAGVPRISRMPPALFRFKVFDPSGNVLIVIDRREPEPDYASTSGTSPLSRALEQAVFLRDTYANDQKAANVLRSALERHPLAPAIERARALACLAELGVAMRAIELVADVRRQLDAIVLSSDERQRFSQELGAAVELEMWIPCTPRTSGIAK